MRIELQHVHYMPKELKPGVLYVSEEFGTAAHLCACGCGSKIRTPLGPTEWSFEVTDSGPTLHPSVGNWQLACKSHYWIDMGEIKWSGKWTPEAIAAGRLAEEERRCTYYDTLSPQHVGIFRKFWSWVTNLLKR
jgi:hypothetical protein